MTITIEAIERGNPSALVHVAEQLRRDAKKVATLAESAREHVQWGGMWEGSAADAAGRAADASSAPLQALGWSGQAAAVVSGAHARALVAAQAVVRGAVAVARRVFFQVTPSGEVLPSLAALVPNLVLAAEGLATALSAVLKDALGFVAMLDTAAGAAVRALHGGAPAAPGPVRAIPHEPVAGIPVVHQRGAAGPIITVGDVEGAEEIVTLVSGVGSSDPGATERSVAWARTQVEHAAAEGKKIAVVAWHDYAAPGSLITAISSLPAHAGARNLEAFQRGLRERNGSSDLRVIGYSYGSVVAGTAARDGLTADRLTLWGSPGANIPDANAMQLRTRAGERSGKQVVGTVLQPGDIISAASNPAVGVHGRDPISPMFGASGDTEAGWGAYWWRKAQDIALFLDGEMDAHSGYLADPQLQPAGR